MKNSCVGMLVVLAALLACKDKSQSQTASEPAPAPTPTPTPEATAPPEPKVPDYRGKYRTNWGSAKCTQAKRNVNCLYAGKGGGLECKISEDDEDLLECDWDEPGLSGKAKLRRKPDGKLVGSWGNGSSSTNGGPWVFTPIEG